MQRSESIAKLSEAMAKAQGNIKGAVKDSDNPFFKSKYADISSIWEACRLPLSENGLCLVQLPRSTETGVEVETILSHSSGEWISEVLALPVSKVDAQAIGSAITYARRYSLAPMVGVAPEDDDGNAAAQSMNKVRSVTLDKLIAAAEKGTPSLQSVWQGLPLDLKKLCQTELSQLKERAKYFDEEIEKSKVSEQ